MRIIAGQRRGHKFDGPAGKDVRPTSDLVREAIFNILADTVEGRVVYDLFAGTGALGLEALSRGAARAIFVERDRAGAALIRRNIATLRYEDRARVAQADALRFALGFEPDDDRPVIVFLDPPYAEYEERRPRIFAALAALVGRTPPGSILVVESRDKLNPELLPQAALWDIRRYGSKQVAFLTTTAPAEAGEQPLATEPTPP